MQEFPGKLWKRKTKTQQALPDIKIYSKASITKTRQCFNIIDNRPGEPNRMSLNRNRFKKPST